MEFKKEHFSYSVKKILDMSSKGKLNLNPGFQRESVWIEKEKRELVDTILRGLPLPNIFLWQRKEGNKVVFDVIDGKQRIESILDFTKYRSPLMLKQFDPDGDPLWGYQDKWDWAWKEIKKDEPRVAKSFLSYEIPVVVVTGDLQDIEEVFIRINSTGKKLSKQEVRHAKWYKNSHLLKAAEEIARSTKYRKYFVEMSILSDSQVTRMKAVELISELMLTFNNQAVLDRKKSLDSIMANNVDGREVSRMCKEVKWVLDWIKSNFPELNTTRFKKRADFYALCFVVWKLNRDGYNLKNKKRVALSFAILTRLGLELAQHNESFKSGRRYILKSPAREYHETIIAGSDSALNRRKRVQIIESLIRPLFEEKDRKRLFSQEQKQLLWHSNKDKTCSNTKCKKALTWKDVQLDHVIPHSKGGKTELKNAQIMCASCNLSKGNKTNRK